MKKVSLGGLFFCFAKQVPLFLEGLIYLLFLGLKLRLVPPAPYKVLTYLLSDVRAPCGMALGCDGRLFRVLLSAFNMHVLISFPGLAFILTTTRKGAFALFWGSLESNVTFLGLVLWFFMLINSCLRILSQMTPAPQPPLTPLFRLLRLTLNVCNQNR